MADFESAINDAVAAQDIPGCVLAATNRDGSFTYSKSFGNTSMDPDRAKPISPGTIMWVASCTKLMTSVCALQLVERGLVKLDDPVYKHIPELESLTVIKEIGEDGKPIEEKHTKPITLRLLLTHSSGLAYDGLHPNLIAWSAYYKKGAGVHPTILERYNKPLVFEPGEGWMYGPSIDYVGLLIERITGQTLEEYMKEYLWAPLGIKDATFNLGRRPDLKERMADMSLRDETGKVKFTDTPLPHQDGEGNEVVDCMGGVGLLTSAEEYIKTLHAVLTTEDDERLLKKETLELFFSPQLGEQSSFMLNAMLQSDMANNAMGGTDKNVKKDWGLGGLLLVGDSPDGMKAGTMLWGGYPNLVWWADRKAGLCGLYASQVVPPGDPKCVSLTQEFRAAMYEQYAGIQRV